MSNQIVACLNVYNEYSTIGASLRSIMPFIDAVILVDGAYKDFPMFSDLSNDGTVEAARYIVKSEWNKGFTTISFHERHTEVEKRTAYLQYIQRYMDWQHAWAFIWDADMFLKPYGAGDIVADFSGLRETEDVPLATMNLMNGSDPAISTMIIAYRGIEGLHYDRTHFGLWDKHDGVVNASYGKVIHMGNCLIHHDRSLRPKSRIEAQGIYYNKTRLRYEV